MCCQYRNSLENMRLHFSEVHGFFVLVSLARQRVPVPAAPVIGTRIDSEKRAALQLWADALAGIVGDGPTEVRGYHARLARLKGADKVNG